MNSNKGHRKNELTAKTKMKILHLWQIENQWKKREQGNSSLPPNLFTFCFDWSKFSKWKWSGFVYRCDTYVLSTRIENRYCSHKIILHAIFPRALTTPHDWKVKFSIISNGIAVESHTNNIKYTTQRASYAEQACWAAIRGGGGGRRSSGKELSEMRENERTDIHQLCCNSF